MDRRQFILSGAALTAATAFAPGAAARTASGLSLDLDKPVPIAMTSTINGKAPLRIEGSVMPSAVTADLALEQAGRIGLTDPARLNKLATWFDAANRTRDLLRTTVRGDLAMVELLLAWAGSDRGRAVGARR